MVRGSESLASKGSYHGLMRTMKLKNKVRPIGKLSEPATCVPEMSAMMACWRKNNFEDVPCRKEIEMFLTCSKKVRENPEAHRPKGPYKWSSTVVNERLRRFVWPQ